MKLWLLDADVIIELLKHGIFEKLSNLHEVHVASTVVGEVKGYFDDEGRFVSVNFRNNYADNGKITEESASSDEMKSLMGKLPPLKQKSIDDGELESLAVLTRDDSMTLCTCDGAAIKSLPFLDATERAISVEKLLQLSGLTLSPQHKRSDHKLSEAYFKNKLDEGRREFMQTPIKK